MTSPRLTREIPTHLDIEDRLLLGLTARQATHLLAGGSLAYSAWDGTPDLPLALRAIAAGALTLAAALTALLRPLGRPLEEWGFAALRYAALPKRTTWQPPPPQAGPAVRPDGGWSDLPPALVQATEAKGGAL